MCQTDMEFVLISLAQVTLWTALIAVILYGIFATLRLVGVVLPQMIINLLFIMAAVSVVVIFVQVFLF
jgi:hypothetical protein